MPWPRPRRALCFLCVASCESVASSFGVNSVLAAAAAKAGPAAHNRAVNLARGGGGAGSHGSSGGGSSLGTASGGGVHDSGGSGGGRKVVSVQAVAEVQPVVVPEDLAEAAAAAAAAPDVGVEPTESSPQPPGPTQSPPPPPPSLEDGKLFLWLVAAPWLSPCLRSIASGCPLRRCRRLIVSLSVSEFAQGWSLPKYKYCTSTVRAPPRDESPVNGNNLPTVAPSCMYVV